MKPIEPGCLAIVIGSKSEFLGMQVLVIDRAPLPQQRMPNGVFTVGGPGAWIIESTRPVPVEMTDGTWRNVTMGTAPEHKLLRIDGGEEERAEQTQDDEVSA